MKHSLRDIVGLILALLGCAIQLWNAFVSELPNQMVFGYSMLMLAISCLLLYLDPKRKIQSKIEYAAIVVWIVILIVSIFNLFI